MCEFTVFIFLSSRESPTIRWGRKQPKPRDIWCKLALERMARAPHRRRWFLGAPLKYHSTGWEENMESLFWFKQATTWSLLLMIDMVISWQLPEAAKTHLEEGPPSSDTLQVGQDGASMATMPIWSSCAAVQPVRSHRAQEAQGLPETSISPHLAHPEQSHKITPTWCCSRSGSVWLLTHVLPASRFSSHMLLPRTSSALCWLFFHKPVPLTKPAENSPMKTNKQQNKQNQRKPKYFFFLKPTNPQEKTNKMKQQQNKTTQTNSTKCFQEMNEHCKGQVSTVADALKQQQHEAGGREDGARNHPFWQQQTENSSVITPGCIFQAAQYFTEIYASHPSLRVFNFSSLLTENGWSERFL